MESSLIKIEEPRVFPLAEKRFISTCGLDLENNKKHKRMMQLGYEVREAGLAGIDIRAVVSYFDKEAFHDGVLHVGGTELTCNYMHRIPEEAVEGVYVYMLTAGECLFSSEENIMEFLDADIWGTAYVDGGIEALKEDYIIPDMLERFRDSGKSVFLSEEFGPGYFGMPVIETRKFEAVLDPTKIGVRVKESGLMIPQKSCTGFFLVYNRDDMSAEPACMRCAGNSKGCDFCSVRAKLEG